MKHKIFQDFLLNGSHQRSTHCRQLLDTDVVVDILTKINLLILTGFGFVFWRVKVKSLFLTTL
jgi:hypothetical protein